MKNTKKLLALFLAVLMLLSLAACGGGKEPEKPTEIGGGNEPEKPAEIGGDISAGELLLVDKDGMKITLTSIEDEGDYWHFNLRGENKSDKTVKIKLENMVLNGYIDPDNRAQTPFENFAPGETKEDFIYVYRQPELKGIFDKVIKAEITFGMYEDNNLVEKYPVATVYGADKDAQMPSVQDGKLVYDKNNVKIWVDKDVYPNRNNDGVNVYFNIENNSGKEIHVNTAGDYEINGLPAKNMVGLSKIGDGLKLRAYVAPLSSDEKADFSKVTSLKMSLIVRATDESWTDEIDTFDLFK